VLASRRNSPRMPATPWRSITPAGTSRRQRARTMLVLTVEELRELTDRMRPSAPARLSAPLGVGHEGGLAFLPGHHDRRRGPPGRTRPSLLTTQALTRAGVSGITSACSTRCATPIASLSRLTVQNAGVICVLPKERAPTVWSAARGGHAAAPVPPSRASRDDPTST
jgi:hypothetical protein